MGIDFSTNSPVDKLVERLNRQGEIMREALEKIAAMPCADGSRSHAIIQIAREALASTPKPVEPETHAHAWEPNPDDGLERCKCGAVLCPVCGKPSEPAPKQEEGTS